MDTIMWFVIVVYIAIGIVFALDYWDSHTEKEKEEAEKGMVGIILLFVTFLWPVKFIYQLIRKVL